VVPGAGAAKTCVTPFMRLIAGAAVA
jgi:hypothetical protein